MSSAPKVWTLSDETLRDDLRSRLVYDAADGMIAIVRVENQGGYYGDRHARLIVLAPELLAALKRAYAPNGPSDVADIERFMREAEEHKAEALALIAKAEGSSPSGEQVRAVTGEPLQSPAGAPIAGRLLK